MYVGGGGSGGGGVAKAGAVCLYERRARSLPDFQHSADRREAVNNDKTKKPISPFFLIKMRANESNSQMNISLLNCLTWEYEQAHKA